MHVHLVFARPKTNPWDLELLGLFENAARAHAFIDRAPMPQRECLEVHRWTLNQHTIDPYWTGDIDGPLVAQAMAAFAIGACMISRGLGEYFVARVVDSAKQGEGIFELMRMWLGATDISARNAIVADLELFIGVSASVGSEVASTEAPRLPESCP